jgi:hypothetical protein
LSGLIGKKDEENESYGRKHSLGRDCDKLINEYGKQKLLRKNIENTKKKKCSLVTKSIFKQNQYRNLKKISTVNKKQFFGYWSEGETKKILKEPKKKFNKNNVLGKKR